MAKKVASEVGGFLAVSARLSAELGPWTSALLAALRAKDLLPVELGHERFKTGTLLKDDLYGLVRAGWWVTGGMKLATVRDGVALLDCFRWELLRKLEEGNWQLKIVRKRSRLPEPYRVDANMEKCPCLLLSKNNLEKGDCLLFTRGGRGSGVVLGVVSYQRSGSGCDSLF